MLLLPKQLWYCIGIIILLIAMVILISVDNKDQRNHMDKYVDSHKKKIEVLDEVLESKFQINNKFHVFEPFATSPALYLIGVPFSSY